MSGLLLGSDHTSTNTSTIPGARVQPGINPQLELAEVSGQLEVQSTQEVVAWARDRFGEGLVLASSFQDCVLLDIAIAAFPALEVVFLDTGAHFSETLEYVGVVRGRYDLNLTVLHPSEEAGSWPCGTSGCCEYRKVRPLNAHLANRQAWMTGLRRVETPQRADAPIVGWDLARSLVKVNPLAGWSDQDMTTYVGEHDLPVHPLTAAGYPSIGCAPATRPVAEGEDQRAGRWAGTDKTECGLHL